MDVMHSNLTNENDIASKVNLLGFPLKFVRFTVRFLLGFSGGIE